MTQNVCLTLFKSVILTLDITTTSTKRFLCLEKTFSEDPDDNVFYILIQFICWFHWLVQSDSVIQWFHGKYIFTVIIQWFFYTKQLHSPEQSIANNSQGSWKPREYNQDEIRHETILNGEERNSMDIKCKIQRCKFLLRFLKGFCHPRNDDKQQLILKK